MAVLCLLVAVPVAIGLWLGDWRTAAKPPSPKRPAATLRPPDAEPTPAQKQLLSLLLPNPQIVNTHEHLMQTAGEGARLKLEAANRRSGVVSTALVASSLYTFTLQKGIGFIDHHKNNEYLCRLATLHPGEYYAFVTFDPEEEGIVRKLEEYLGKGATGVKLYAGHGANVGDDEPFHVCPLDDPRLLALYDYCQAHRVPICLHINLRKFEAETRRVLDRYPKLPLIIPHFGLWSGSDRRARLDRLLTDYPNVMTDNSFGWWYSVPGLKRYDPKNDKRPPSMRDFFIKHQDRILFGTDVVVTAGAGKSADALTDFWLAYRCSLELEEYEFRDKDRKLHRFKGLTLPEDVLRKVYRENWVRFLTQCGRYVPLDGPRVQSTGSAANPD